MLTAPIASPPANPFSTQFVRPNRTAYRFVGGEDAGVVAAAMIAQLTRYGTAAIIGPHGTGKTTLLHTLAEPLSEAFLRVPLIRLSSASDAAQELRQWQLDQVPADGASPARSACLVIDGFEQLPWAARQRLIWRARRMATPWRPQHRRTASRPCLLITAHRPQFGVKTVYRTRWNSALVKILTAEKLRDLPPSARQTMLRLAEQRAMRLEHGRPAERNVRDYWFSLYDEYERFRAHDSFAAGTRRRDA